jgi:hypothetical protein
MASIVRLWSRPRQRLSWLSYVMIFLSFSRHCHNNTSIRPQPLPYMLKKGKSIPVTGRGGPQGCEKLRFSHFLDNRLTDDSETVGLTCWPPFTPRKIPGTHFCYRLIWPQGHSATVTMRSTEISNDLIGNQTCDLLACSIIHSFIHSFIYLHSIRSLQGRRDNQ